MSQHEWTSEDVGSLLRAYHASAVLAAGAELEIFDLLAAHALSAEDAALRLEADPRGVRTLLDALAALGLLSKDGRTYRVPQRLVPLLTGDGPQSMLAMAQHQAACLRRWSHLAQVVKSGLPAPRTAGIRGAQAEYASFIEAMDNVGRALAAGVIASLGPLAFTHLLDVGGASGTYTIAFLRAYPNARATIFDLPQVMPQARQRIASAGLSDRVTLVPGDFYVDPLPAGADLAWVSAIVHQNSCEQNRDLFGRVFEALVPGGSILVRDFLMDETRTRPIAGALFAVNMLVGTPMGGTFTVGELTEDLASAGFRDSRVVRQDDTMNSVLCAVKPRGA